METRRLPREETVKPIWKKHWPATVHEASIRLPETPGNYRIFVYAYDAAGNAATANVPVMIK